MFFNFVIYLRLTKFGWQGQMEMDHYEEDPGLIGNSICAQKVGLVDDSNF